MVSTPTYPISFHQSNPNPTPLLPTSSIPAANPRLIKGVKSFDVSLEKQTADVFTNDDSLDYETVLQTIKKTGKAVKSGEADGEEKSVE